MLDSAIKDGSIIKSLPTKFAGVTLNNIITGNSGKNVLDGGAGNDTLKGGLGDDTYLYGTGSGNDIIDSYEGTGANGTDKVQFGQGLTSDSFSYQQSGQNLVLQIKASGETLTFTNWFNGADYQVDSFVFADSSTMTAAQVTSRVSGTGTITGTADNDTLNGSANNDIINGLGGDDTLNGGLGADTMIGGTGDEYYVVDNIGDIITENANEGHEVVESSVSYTLGANLEELHLTGTANINGTGNGLDNYIEGNDGNNSLKGGAGSDVLYGGGGSDILEGGLGDDTYIFGVGSGNDTINSYVGANTDNGYDTLEFQDLALSDMLFTKNGNDLICKINQTGETVRLSNWLLGENYQVDQFEFSDGTLTSVEISKKAV